MHEQRLQGVCLCMGKRVCREERFYCRAQQPRAVMLLMISARRRRSAMPLLPCAVGSQLETQMSTKGGAALDWQICALCVICVQCAADLPQTVPVAGKWGDMSAC